jgi:hypothetical protein
MTDEWLYPALLKEEDKLFNVTKEDDEEEIIMDRGINNYFDDNGISSMFLIKNLGSTLVYLVFIVVAYFTLVLSFILSALS